MKRMSDSYLYQESGYSRELYSFIINAQRIDPTKPDFESVVYNVKMRQVSPSLVKILMSNRVVLCTDNKKGMSRAFKVFQAIDPKSPVKGDRKIFIDCTKLIVEKNGTYACTNIGTLISYLVSALSYGLYYSLPATVMSNNALIKAATEIFVDLSLYTLGFLKVPVTLNDNKERLSFILAEYFLFNVLQISNTDSVIAIAKKVSKLDKYQATHVVFADTLADGNCSIDKFIKSIQTLFLGQDELKMKTSTLTTEAFVEKWAYLFGPSTYLGLELFPAFSTMVTDCFVGSYINQQNTIEKIAGKNIIVYSNELLKIGSENI